MLPKRLLTRRLGPKPDTTDRLPHSQLNQHGPDPIVQRLHDWCFNLPDVLNEKSLISVPGSRALVLKGGVGCNDQAFMVGREFAHIHPHPDSGSMHLKLHPEDARSAIECGWGESHYLVNQGNYPFGLIMVYSPRDSHELETIKEIILSAYKFALGGRD